MKKVLVFISVFVFLCSLAAAENYDFTAMSDDELFHALNLVRNEMKKRNIGDERIISQYDEATIYYDKTKFNTKNYVDIVFVAINSGDKPVYIIFDKIIINGWSISLSFEGVRLDPGEKKKDVITFYDFADKTDIESSKEIEDIELYSHGYNLITDQDDEMMIRKIILN